jgi:hypothetical protein
LHQRASWLNNSRFFNPLFLNCVVWIRFFSHKKQDQGSCKLFITCLVYYGEALLAACPILKLEDHPLVVCLRLLTHCIPSIAGGRSSIRNQTTSHAVVTGNHHTLCLRYSANNNWSMKFRETIIEESQWSWLCCNTLRITEFLGRCLSTNLKLVPTFADRGCHVVSVTDPYGRILWFLDRSRYFSIK